MHAQRLMAPGLICVMPTLFKPSSTYCNMRDSEEDGKPEEEVSKNDTEFHGPMPPTHVAHSETESQ